MGRWKNPSKLRDLNRENILEIIKREGCTTRVEITKQSEISHTTVRKILENLLEEGKVKVVGIEKSTGGRRAKKYRLVEENKYLLAVYLKKDSIVYKYTNQYGERIVDGEVSSDRGNKVDIIRSIIEKIQEVYYKLERICIVFSNTEEYVYNEVRSLEEKFDFTISYMWERNAILYEYIVANKRQMKNMMYLDFSGEGFGTSIYVNGRLINKENENMGSFYNIDKENGILKSLKEVINISSSLLNIEVLILGGENFKVNYLHNIKDEFNNLNIIELNDESFPLEGAIKYLLGLGSS